MSKWLIGGIFETYDDYLNHWMWDEKRKIEIDHYKICQRCGSNKILQVHHLNYSNVVNEKSSDLMVLCKKCHNKIHKK